MRYRFSLLAVVVALLSGYSSACGQATTITEITRLDQLERQSVLKGDTATLFRLWAKEFVVNNPDNQIVTGQQVKGLIRSGKMDYTSFQHLIEKVTLAGDVAIVMGREIVTPEKKTTTRQPKP